MKAVKRQTRSRESESEQNEVNERKKARLSNDSNVSPKKKNDENESSITPAETETNGDSSMPELCPVITKPSEPKTSTPIVHNGSVGSFVAKFHNSAHPEVSPVPRPNATPENEHEDAPMTEENNEKEHSISDAAAGDANADADAEKKNIDSQEVVDEKPVEEPLEVRSSANGSTPSVEARCDVDMFLSSFLQAYELEGHADSVTAVAADKDILISASLDTTIKQWDLHNKQELRNFQGHTGSVTAIVLLSAEQSSALSSKMSFPDNTRILISGSTDCSIRLWSVHEGLELLSIYTYNGITSLGFVESQNYIAVGTDGGKLELWDLCYSKVLHSVVAHDEGVTDVKVDDCYIYTTSSDGKVKVWLYEDDELQPIYSRTRKSPASGGHGDMSPTRWNCLSFHENTLFLGDDTSDIKILDWKAGRIGMRKNQREEDGLIDAVCVKENVLLSSSFDPNKHVGAINVWELPDIQYICTMSGDIGTVSAVDLTFHDGILRVVSGGSKLVVWDYVCSKPAASGANDKFLCQKVESLGDDSAREASDSSGSGCLPEDHPDAVDSTSISRKCTFL